MILERHSASTHNNKYRRLTTGDDTVMSDFATGPLTVNDSRYQAPEMTRQWVMQIRLCRSHRRRTTQHMSPHNNTKHKSP